jgi:KDO2-lipid IV(A) lauroyltransferase
MKLARVFIARIPPALGHPLAAVLGELIYRLAGRSRRAAISNLGHAMGPIPRRALKKAVRHVFHNLMRNYYELCRAPDMTDADIDRMIDFDEKGWQRIVDLHNSGRGVLLVAQVKPAWLSDFISDLRAARGLNLLLVDEEEGSGVNLMALKQSINIIRNNGLLGVIVDRNMEQRGVTIKFFGHDTVVAAGAAKMALRTRSPIVLGIARRLNNYRFSLTFDEPIEPVGSAANEEDVKAILTRIFARVEYHIAQNPEQWVLLQPVWPSKETHG